MLFLVFVGGCIAVVAVVGNKVNDVVNDDTLGGPNNPLTITEGKAFTVNGFEYADGWSIVGEPVSQTWHVDNLKVTNNRGKPDRLDVKIELSSVERDRRHDRSARRATASTRSPKDTTVTVDCVSSTRCPRPTTRSRSSDII